MKKKCVFYDSTWQLFLYYEISFAHIQEIIILKKITTQIFHFYSLIEYIYVCVKREIINKITYNTFFQAKLNNYF